MQRLAGSPRTQLEYFTLTTLRVDIRHLLPLIDVPTLVLACTGDLLYPLEHSRFVAGRIAGSRLVVFEGTDHLYWSQNGDAVAAEVEQLCTGTRHGGSLERVLATVLFTDIVGSTELAASLGDRRWGELVEGHHRIVRGHLERFRGTEVDTAGDGFFATFDTPARAVRCAQAILDGLAEMGITIRAGVHVGECEVMDGKVGGIAVNVGARIAGRAEGGEILVSRTVVDLVAGSGIRFDERGEHELKGVPGTWQLHAVVAEGGAGRPGSVSGR